MTAAVFEGEGRLAIKDAPRPKVRRGDEVLIKVLACGVCGTDLHILSVPPGHPATPGVILGHEYTGEVVDVGDEVSNVRPGDRVVVDPNVTCGYCRYCQAGMRHMCSNMTTLGIFIDGGFAPYNVAPAGAVYPIDSSVPPHLAAFAEILACIANGARKVMVQPGDSVVILGAGPAGLLFTQVAKAAGAGTLIVVETSPFRRRFALESGADIAVDPREVDLKEIVMEKTRVGADVVVDAVGSLFGTALPLVRRQGKVLLFGMDQTSTTPIRQVDITRNEIQVIGSYIADFTFPAAIKMIESGVLPLEKLITHRLPVGELQTGLDALKNREAIKIIVDPWMPSR